MCAGYCELESWQTLHAPYELLVLGGSTFLGVAHTIGFAVHAVIVVRKRQPARVKVRWTIATAVATLAAGVAFLVRAPRLLPGVRDDRELRTVRGVRGDRRARGADGAPAGYQLELTHTAPPPDVGTIATSVFGCSLRRVHRNTA